jgi:twitching motility protein PilT
MHSPSITPERLLHALIEQGVLEEAAIVGLLGNDRHNLSLNRLEMAVTTNGVISDGRLAALKGMVAGLHAVTNEDAIGILDTLPAAVAKKFGILLVDRPQPTVAMVEDTEINLQAARQAVGGQDIEVWLITAGQFASLWGQVYREKVRSSRNVEVQSITQVLDWAVEEGASDIHLKVNQPPWMRVDGRAVKMQARPLDQPWLERELAVLVGENGVREAMTTFRVDRAFSYGTHRFRLNLGMDRHGLTLVARKLPTIIPSVDDLNLPLAVRRFADLERGLVLVTGPTGSGKSTTLAALLAEVLRSPRTMITLEDPIEFSFESREGLVYQREFSKHFTSFAEALKAALRQDPDVILVGEMRDLETMRTAVTAAETGHLVFATLHTSSAESTVARLINQFPADEQNQIRAQLTSVLKGVVSQSLIPRKSGKGRVAAFEIMVSNPAVANNLRTVEGMKHLRNTIATGSREGMQTMEMALVDLVVRDVVSVEKAEFIARDVKDFHSRLAESRGLNSGAGRA